MIAFRPLQGMLVLAPMAGVGFLPLAVDAAGLVTLADKGYQGAAHATIPYRARTSPDPKDRPTAPTRNTAHQASANAHLKTWHILRKLCCCPWRAGQLAKVIHVLQVREA